MGRIFLSYAREDRTFAETLTRVLEGASHSVWWDRHIDSGEEFAAEIEAQLDKADVVLVVWSKDSVKSRWVRDEAAAGGDTGRLVPVSLDGSPPPMGFRQFQTLDLVGWRGGKRDARTGQLLNAIERRLGKETRPEARTPRPPVRRASPNRAVLWAAAAALLLVLAAAAILLLRNRQQEGGAPLKPTIAVVPFTAASSDPELRSIASQARDSIVHSFSQSGFPVGLLNSVAPKPNVDFLIAADVSRNADKVVAIVHLDEVAHGVTVFSHRFEASETEVRDLPERIGAQMAGNLTWAAPMTYLDRRHPIDPALLTDLLQTVDFTADRLQAYQNSKRVAAKAPDLQAGLLGVAFQTSFVLAQLPREERIEAVAEARRAADRALALAPGFGDTYAAWCGLHSETRRAECEDRLRAGRRIDPDAPFLNTFLSHLMRNVGRFEEAMELARLAHTHDVYVPTKIAWMLKTMEYAGEGDAARNLYRQGVLWWPEYQPMLFRNRLFGLIELGDVVAMDRLEKEVGSGNLPGDYLRSDALAAAVKSKSVDLARRACRAPDDYFLSLRCMIVLARLGDEDGAYAITDKLYPRRVGRTAAETERIWLDEPDANALEFITSPGSAPLRRDPRYIALAERTGLLNYWRSGHPPDFCRKKPEEICAQLLKR